MNRSLYSVEMQPSHDEVTVALKIGYPNIFAKKCRTPSNIFLCRTGSCGGGNTIAADGGRRLDNGKEASVGDGLNVRMACASAWG